MHCKEQPGQAKVVVAMQVTYKNMIDFVIGQLKSHELHLSPFTTVDKKMVILYFYPVRRRKTPVSGESGAGAEDNDLKLGLGADFA